MPTREALDVLETPTGEFTVLPRPEEDPFDLGLRTRTLATLARSASPRTCQG